MPARHAPRFFLVGFLHVLLLPAAADAAVVVQNERQFHAAVARLGGSGGTIVLAPGRYGQLAVGSRGERRLVVRARAGASVGRITLTRTRNVRFENLLVTPGGEPAEIRVDRSVRIAFHRLRLRGTTSRPARLLLPWSTGIAIRRSRFSNCGDGGVCILLARSAGVGILRSRFRDCLGCDFVRGAVRYGLVIRGNRFDRALRGPCGGDAAVCNHNDLVQLQGGRDVLVERNVFGVYQQPGAAQLYLSGPLNGVTVRDNLFRARDRTIPELRVPANGIVVGNRVDRGTPLSILPSRVKVAHNTILSGRRRGRGAYPALANSLTVSYRYRNLRPKRRPAVMNNVLALTDSPGHLCGAARMARNVTIAGVACSERDVVADPLLDARGAPTAESTVLIDQARRGWSTSDLLGRPRGTAPDIGAFEYVPAP